MKPTIVIDVVRLPDGSDQVRFRGAFEYGVPEELLEQPPAGTSRQMFTAPLGRLVDVACFRLVQVTPAAAAAVRRSA